MDVARARADMPACQERIYLDHAGVAPLSGPAAEVVAAAAADMARNGWLNRKRWGRLVDRGRVLFARMIGAAPGDIAYVKNTSQGLLLAANSLPLGEGDNVVVFHGEFPANVYPWLALARRGVETRLVRPEPDRRIPPGLVASVMDSRTRAVALSAVQFGSGFRADLGAIGDLCRARGAYFVVDMIQCVGAVPMDVSETPFDVGAADGHKWLLGPEGIGYLYCRPEILDQLAPTYMGWNSVRDAYDFEHYDATPRPDARRFEEGSLNVLGACGLAASVELLASWGRDWVYARVLELTHHVAEQVRRRGFELLSPMERLEERSGIVIFRVPGHDSGALVESLVSGGVLCAARGGGIRFSPHAYNTEDEIDEAFRRLDGQV
ncbi:MAG TPA: aminotransferase class V-fold PLP-dependent enzyme [Armatimonadota bacterium]|nr:aminotransferase class V-fold PLP-dependent enzyme [Armatimonadota bacterium]HQK94096.1 aminotransferase class V-fold PLP-dependent enzyme [Armatimonadota bacterium]